MTEVLHPPTLPAELLLVGIVDHDVVPGDWLAEYIEAHDYDPWDFRVTVRELPSPYAEMCGLPPNCYAVHWAYVFDNPRPIPIFAWGVDLDAVLDDAIDWIREVASRPRRPLTEAERERLRALLIDMPTWDDPEWAETERADGRVECQLCGREYRHHPEAANVPSIHRICAGAWPREGRPEVRWVKT